MTHTFDMDALAARVRTKREAAGTNVHFVNSGGKRDCYSFATKERADAFRAKLTSIGRELL